MIDGYQMMPKIFFYFKNNIQLKEIRMSKSLDSFREQRSYEDIFKNPNADEKLVNELAIKCTRTPLKKLAIQHPKLNQATMKYIISKADGKTYQEELLNSFWLRDDIEYDILSSIMMLFNTQSRFQLITNKLLYEQIDISEKHLNRYFLCIKFDEHFIDTVIAIIKHKNFGRESIIHLASKKLLATNDKIVDIVKDKFKNDAELFQRLYELSQNELWLSKEVKDIFIF